MVIPNHLESATPDAESVSHRTFDVSREEATLPPSLREGRRGDGRYKSPQPRLIDAAIAYAVFPEELEDVISHPGSMSELDHKRVSLEDTTDLRQIPQILR